MNLITTFMLFYICFSLFKIKLECQRFILESGWKGNGYLIALDGVLDRLAVLQQNQLTLRLVFCPGNGLRSLLSIFQCIDGVEGLAILVCGKPYLAIIIVSSIDGRVNSLTVLVEPVSYLQEVFHNFRLPSDQRRVRDIRPLPQFLREYRSPC